MLSWLNRKLDRQWLAAWTLVAFVATLVLMYVLSGVSAPLREKTGLTLVSLQLAGACPILKHACPIVEGTRQEEEAPEKIIAAWRHADVLSAARLDQFIDFFFPLAYGMFSLLLAVGMWRCHPAYPVDGQWVWGIAAGARAALCDECENIFLWNMLSGSGDPGWPVPALTSLFAIAKFVFLFLALASFLRALRYAQA
jgi:hypothetical protein